MNKSTTPPVCRLGNLGKLKYEANKSKDKNRKREQEVKTLKLRPGTHKHDLDIEVRKAKEFLLKGDKVKLECRFKFREQAHPHLGKANLDYIYEELKDICKIEKPHEMFGKSMILIIVPNK